MCKRFILVQAAIRVRVDLRNYRDVITTAYLIVNANLVVVVFQDYYLVNGNLTRSQAIRAGKQIAKSSLGRYAVKYPKNSSNPTSVQLFKSA